MPTRKAWCQPPSVITLSFSPPNRASDHDFQVSVAQGFLCSRSMKKHWLSLGYGQKISWAAAQDLDSPTGCSLKRPRVLSPVPQTFVQVPDPFKTFLALVSSFHHCLPLILSWIPHAYGFPCSCARLVPTLFPGACLALTLLFSLVAQFTFSLCYL